MTNRQRQVYRTETGFTDNGSLLSCCMFWDEFGTYLGQEQLNVIDPEGPPTFFYKAQGNEEPVKFSLSAEEMANALTSIEGQL